MKSHLVRLRKELIKRGISTELFKGLVADTIADIIKTIWTHEQIRDFFLDVGNRKASDFKLNGDDFLKYEIQFHEEGGSLEWFFTDYLDEVSEFCKIEPESSSNNECLQRLKSELKKRGISEEQFRIISAFDNAQVLKEEKDQADITTYLLGQKEGKPWDFTLEGDNFLLREIEIYYISGNLEWFLTTYLDEVKRIYID